MTGHSVSLNKEPKARKEPNASKADLSYCPMGATGWGVQLNGSQNGSLPA